MHPPPTSRLPPPTPHYKQHCMPPPNSIAALQMPCTSSTSPKAEHGQFHLLYCASFLLKSVIPPGGRSRSGGSQKTPSSQVWPQLPGSFRQGAGKKWRGQVRDRKGPRQRCWPFRTWDVVRERSGRKKMTANGLGLGLPRDSVGFKQTSKCITTLCH